MFIGMGATGHVGGAVASQLLARGEKITILTRKPEGADRWRERGANVAIADAADTRSLKDAFRLGRRAFLLNPPADPSGDTDRAERRTIGNILAALNGSGLEKVVAASTYGAQPGHGIGDLSTLWELEEGLRSQEMPAAINRGAYYMTNWLGFADNVRQSGKLPSMFPANFEIPMVAPDDLGQAAVERLLSPTGDTALWHVEGPKRYTPQAVADAFAATLDREVTVDVAPREQWEAIYRDLGFSDKAASSYSKMIAASLDEGFDETAPDERGRTTLTTFMTEKLGK